MPDSVITTIIPTFRRPKLLRRAIESVLAQSYRYVKVCVYDNASGDETEEIVAGYVRCDDRVVYIKNGANIGAANNMIQGVKAVTTDFYSLLSDDDFLLPDFYSQAIAAFETHPQAGFVCAKTIAVDFTNKRLKLQNREWRPGLHQPSNGATSKMYRSHFTQTGVLLRTRMRESVGPFEKSGDDRLYLVMASAASPFVVIDMYGAVFTIHPEAYSVARGLRQDDAAPASEALLSTVDRVMALKIPVDRKVHLLLLVFRAYGATFDLRRLRQLEAGVGRNGESAGETLPSCTTFYGLLVRTCEMAPKRMYPVVRRCVNGIMHFRRRKRFRERDGWRVLPEDSYSLLRCEDSDVSRFLPSIQETGYRC